jgi:hypothetical protein
MKTPTIAQTLLGNTGYEDAAAPPLQGFAEETKTKDEYYNGEDGLNVINETCHAKAQQVCFGESNCGWCSENGGSCVSGGPTGPSTGCSKDYYQYSAPIMNLLNTDRAYLTNIGGTLATVHNN